MACSCKVRLTGSRNGVLSMNADTQASLFSAPPVVPELPHSILPGDSCIFCAEKHLSLAYTAYTQQARRGEVLGEIELARRHTLLEYPDIAARIAELEIPVMRRDRAAPARLFPGLLEAVDAEVMRTEQQQEIPESDGYQLDIQPPAVKNPFLGELHFCAAWRLAFEVGYMMPNKAMILGDLALAREHLVRFSSDLSNKLRDFRHRVQTMRAADLKLDWAETAGEISALLARDFPGYLSRYMPEAEAYIRA